jgi:hypothetical protein
MNSPWVSRMHHATYLGTSQLGSWDGNALPPAPRRFVNAPSVRERTHTAGWLMAGWVRDLEFSTGFYRSRMPSVSDGEQ